MRKTTGRGQRWLAILAALLLSVVLLSAACSRRKAAVYAPDLLARVDGHEITTTEFAGRLRYVVPADSLRALADTSSRARLLGDLIDERLAAIYAEKQGLVDSAAVQDALDRVRRQAMLRELYLREVRDKAAVSEQELRRAYRRWREELTVGFYRAATREEAEWVRQGILAGKSFAELATERYKRRFDEGQFRRKLRWGETDPALEEAAYSLRLGEVSKPIRVGQMYYVVQLLDRRMLGKPTEEDFQRVAPALRHKLLRRKEEALASRFLREHLSHAQIRLHGDVLGELVRWLEKRATEDSVVELFPEEVDSLLAGFDFRDSTLVTFSGQRWTVEKALKQVEPTRLSVGSPEKLVDQLSRALFETARDEVLVEAARNLGLDRHPRVLRDVSVWKDYLAAEILKRRVGLPRVLAVVDSMRGQVPIVVLKTKLASLDLASSDTSVVQQTTPFRELAFPPWPQWSSRQAATPSR